VLGGEHEDAQDHLRVRERKGGRGGGREGGRDGKREREGEREREEKMREKEAGRGKGGVGGVSVHARKLESCVRHVLGGEEDKGAKPRR
jgi:hypothetical protein